MILLGFIVHQQVLVDRLSLHRLSGGLKGNAVNVCELEFAHF